MTKYNLTCDNGQVMEMNVNDQIPGVTLEGEIVKLKELFVQLAADKAATGQHPAGWLDPLPTDVVSWEVVNE
jgi:hypothetical protein